MATGGGGFIDPGGGRGGGGGRPPSYAERLKTNVSYDQRLKRNVLEIVLEKIEEHAEIVIDQECVARVLRSIGMDVMTQVEGYQVHFNGRANMISVWASKDLNLERFCRAEGINVSKGIMTGSIRPAGRRDVTVTVSGLDFNTPDSLVFDYIKKFGGIIINSNVIYSKFMEGPFQGKCNGERRYQVDFTSSTRSMGTYHFLDGARIRIFYRGNEKTCGRCHESARSCPGGGLARVCEDAGGVRVHLHDHMKKVWAEINFEPSSFELPPSGEDNRENDQPIAEADRFIRNDPRAPETTADMQRYVGLSIANMCLDVGDEEIKKFVTEYVSEEIEADKISIIREKKKAVVTINHSLTAEIVKQAMMTINFSDCKTKFFGRPLYCRPIRDITPEKPSQSSPASTAVNTTSKSMTGSRPKENFQKIPGLPPSAQAKAKLRQKEREKKDRSEKERKKKLREEKERQELEDELKNKKEKIKKNLTAFDVLMGAQQNHSDLVDPRDEMIPAHCSPAPWVSEWAAKYGQEMLHQNRRLSFGSSPCLQQRLSKRGSEHLSSPNSPQQQQVGEILKKSRAEETVDTQI